eukprot:Polyplicarium_translucidae@DN1655_c0_g1_i2.p2
MRNPQPTVLEFLRRSPLECSAHGLGCLVEMSENDAGHVAILSSTIFYPQSGGQPSDTGSLVFESGTVFRVKKAVLGRLDGVVSIHGELDGPVPPAGTPIARQDVDEVPRKLNTRLHSGGHLLDAAVERLGLEWEPGRGYHFPDGPYNEYFVKDIVSSASGV